MLHAARSAAHARAHHTPLHFTSSRASRTHSTHARPHRLSSHLLPCSLFARQVPIELGNLTVKKLMATKLKGNPLADARIRRFVEDDTPTLVKDLLNHVRKNGYKGEAPKGGGGKKGGKKGKGKGKAEKVESEEEEDADASIAELLAAMGGGSDSSDEDDGKKPVKVS